jgi:hypothetical protein
MDLSTHNVKKIFEKQVLELTRRSLNREELFDFQLSGGWLR